MSNNNRQLIEKYSECAQFYDGKAAGYFVCPTCLRGWPLSDANSDPHLVTRGHVVPKALGGREYVLECRDCNSKLGTKFDSALVVHHKRLGFRAGSHAFPATLRVNGRGMPVEWTKTGDSNTLKVPDKIAREFVIDAFLRGGDIKNTSMTLSITHPTERRVRLGSLHTAHLAAFRCFGYEYALSTSGQNVSRILQTGDFGDGVESFSFRMPLVEDRDCPVGEVFIVYKPSRWSCYGVFTARHAQTVEFTVLPCLRKGGLPAPVRDALNSDSSKTTCLFLESNSHFAEREWSLTPWLAHYLLACADERRNASQ